MTSYRPAQERILTYYSGKMGIAAVPGSGKTWTLSHLAAQIVASAALDDDQEVLVVTLVNSAVDNFYRRVSALVETRGLLPYLGYRVRTLHGLAHDIVRERPGLVGLEDRFQILDEREAAGLLDDAAQAWLRAHPYDLDDFIDPGYEDSRRDWARREKLPELVREMAGMLIRIAKDRRLSPERLRARLDELPVPLPLAELGWQVYDDYQRGLAYRGAVDFDDLIRLALQALESDPDYLQRLRQRWPYILEDEAQDSSRLQEEILATLAGPTGNWVRVGDPNQAIYETFTTANPRFLRDFLRRPDVTMRELPNSGRSTFSIIKLANYLVQWTMEEHPLDEVRDALAAPPWIEPAPDGDPQPNPPDDPAGLYLEVMRRFSADDEIRAVAGSLERWLAQRPPGWTVAALAPRNQRGFLLVDELRRRNIPCEDGLLRSSSQTRLAAGALGNLLVYLSDPGSARKLSAAYQVWRRAERGQPTWAQVERHTTLLRQLEHVEDYLWPGPERDWLVDLEAAGADPDELATLEAFRALARRWQAAVLLPVDQLVLALAQDLLDTPAELALTHKLAVLLRQAADLHPGWRLPELSAELGLIARNERRFLGFSDEESGFDPDDPRYQGKVVVATIHKAKGLEWDRVYLLSTNNYDFPSGEPGDSFISEKWFLRNKLNLPAEALAQLQAALSVNEYEWYEEGVATQQARLDYVRERLRLLYVGLTRARRELVVTWNTGRYNESRPALALEKLYEYWGATGNV